MVSGRVCGGVGGMMSGRVWVGGVVSGRVWVWVGGMVSGRECVGDGEW